MIKIAACVFSLVFLPSCSLSGDGAVALSRSSRTVEKGSLIHGDRVTVEVPSAGMYLQKGAPTARSINLKYRDPSMDSDAYAAMVFPRNGNAVESLCAMDHRVQAKGLEVTILQQKPVRFQGRSAWAIEQLVHLPGKPERGVFNCLVGIERSDSILFLAHGDELDVGGEGKSRIRSQFQSWLKSVRLE